MCNCALRSSTQMYRKGPRTGSETVEYLYETGGGDARAAFVHRGRQNQQSESFS